MSWQVQCGDMVDLCGQLEPESIDAVCTDPPYELGFMGKHWDSAGVSFRKETWQAAYRVLKPGGHLLAFGGTRTYHRIACAIEDAGFEIRDCLSWLYGSGFPKSLNVSKAIDKKFGFERDDPTTSSARETANSSSHRGTHICNRCGKYYGSAAANCKCPKSEAISPQAQQWDGFGTALKPAWEPIILARKPFKGTLADNVLKHGTGAINVDGCRIDAGDGYQENTVTQGVNTAQTSWDPRLERSTFDPSPLGRWPANVCLDEEAARQLDKQTGDRPGMSGGGKHRDDYEGGMFGAIDAEHLARDDNGGPSRFFFCAKASRQEREMGLGKFAPVSGGQATGRKDGSDGLNSPRAGAGRTSQGVRNLHPTVKPIELMRWLVRLVCPPGGTVLDPFCGSGTTGIASVLEGFNFIGFDLEPDHCDIASARIAYVIGGNWEPITERATAVEEKQPDLFEGLGS